jgi:4-alpha-glucanotransferase
VAPSIFAALEMYDVVRIDHFRGFESFYAVDYGETTARNGAWLKGPGLEIFEGIRDKLKGFRIIAEDLGYMDDQVRQLLADSGFPGMKILVFGFDPKNASDDAPSSTWATASPTSNA